MSAAGRRRVKSLADIWPGLEAGLVQLMTNLNEGFPRKKWMELYTDVYDYCTTLRVSEAAKTQAGAMLAGKALYKKLVEFLKRHMARLAALAATRMDESLLHFYHTEWERFTTVVRYINHIFGYLNRHWIKRQLEEPSPRAGIYPVNVLAVVVWREEFFAVQEPRITRALLALIEKERCGEQVDAHLLAGVVSGYINLGVSDALGNEKTLGVYRKYLEAPLIGATSTFYAAESSQFIALNPITAYMLKVETRLEEEKQRARQYLYVSSEQPLVKAAEDALVGAHVDALWAAFSQLLADDKEEDLERMYRLLSRRSADRGLQPLRAPFMEHVQASGLAAIEALSNPAPEEYVQTLLRLYTKYATLVKTAFGGDAQFVEGVDKAARRFVNENAVTKSAQSSTKSPELIARYVDSLLRKSAKHDAQEVEMALDQVMSVFRYIEDQDVFQTFYAKLLAKRLIHGTSASEDLEDQMIGRLKAACGFDYTTKLQQMFTNITGSRELMRQFKQTSAGKKLPFDFEVKVLATNAWPLQPSTTNFALPPELERVESLFAAFYVKEHSGRKLNWLHQLAKAEVRTRYTTSNRTGYTFQCSTYQLGVLMLFNALDDNAELTAEQIQTATLLNDNAMRSALLALVKTTVLRISPKPAAGGVINKSHRFKLNLAFKSKKTRVFINLPVPQQRAADNAATQQSIADDRKVLVQAAIVRIMKTRKALPFANLISETVTQLRTFKPKIPVIKRAIDTLIEKEYIERMEDDNNMLAYIP